MPVTIGTGAGEYNAVVQHVSNGDPANQTVFRAPSINLENRTDALKTFTEAQEVIRDAQLGSSALAIGGVQGTFNVNHKHTGSDGSSLIDFQQVYNNGNDIAVFGLAAAGSLAINDNNGDPIITMVNDTRQVTIPVWADDTIPDNALNYGTNAGEINLDSMPDGATYVKVNTTEKNAYDAHLSAGADTVHNLQLQGRPLRINNIAVTGLNHDVTTEMAAETAGGDSVTEGIVTNSPNNLVIVRTADAFDDIVDGYGNRVYGRLTEAAGTWTLTFFSNVAGVETAYSFGSSTSVSCWVQKIYNLSNITTYDPAFSLEKDEVAGLRWSRSRNFVINGDFDFLSVNPATGTVGALTVGPAKWYTLIENTSSAALNYYAQNTAVPTEVESGNRSQHSFMVDVGTDQFSLGLDAYAAMRYVVPGYDFATLQGGKVTLSFWVRALQIGNYCVALRNPNVPDRHYVTEFTVDASATYEYKQLVVDLSDSTLSGSWNFDENPGLWIDFVLLAGGNLQTTDIDSWEDGNKTASTNQVNMAETVGNTYNLSQVTLRKGVDLRSTFEKSGVFGLMEKFLAKTDFSDIT